MKNAIVVGAGVIGLTSAITLLRQELSVEIWAAAFPPHTTSDLAGAIWFPYNIMPAEKAVVWGRQSYEVYAQMLDTFAAGVSMVQYYVAEPNPNSLPATPWWAAGFPQPNCWKISERPAPAGFSFYYELTVPFIDPRIHLQYLMEEARILGAVFKETKVENLGSLSSSYPQHLIVNCTGLGSYELLGDMEMFPIQGHALILSPAQGLQYLKADAAPELPTYIFPRREGVLIGGAAERDNGSQDVRPEMIASVLRRCKALDPRIADLPVLEQYVGLRPGRTAVRLERMGNIIHNYGHGGGGYTVAWGCAAEVGRLANAC